MIGYKQKWDTDVKNGKLGTSIDGWQYQGNSLQLNYLNFEKYTTQKGENGLAIRLGANVDGINKGGNLYFVDTNTKNTALSTVIDDKGNIKLTVTDSDNKKVESTVNISNYVQSEAKKHSSVSTTDKNLSIDSTGTNNAGGIDYKVSLKNDLKLGSVTTGDTKMNTDGVKVGENVSLTKDGLTAGDTKVTNAGLSIGDKTYVSKDGLNANNQTITNVAAGAITETSTDAVNGSQLHAVATEAGKHTTLSNGKNTTVNPVTTADGHLEYKVDVNDELKDIKSIIGAGEGAGSISFADGGIKINNKVTINKDGKITGVAAGAITETSTDAVNGSQLHAVATEAGKHTTLSNGKNTTVNPVTTADGHLEYQVDVNDELKDIKSIIGAGEGAGSISFANDGIKFNNKVTIDNTGKISGVANGIADNDAVNVSQLNKVSAAAKTEVVKGTNIASVVASNATDDGHTVYTVNAKGTSVSVDGNFNLNTTTDDETNVTNYGISLKDSVAIGGTHAVTINGTDGTVTGLTNTTWNKDSITSGRAATEDQLQAVATEAGKHTTLSNGKNTTVKPVTTADGHLEYQVDVNDELKDIKSIIGAGEGAGSISFANDGIKFNNKVTIDNTGKISGVAAGVEKTDAVNVGQLKDYVAANDTHIKSGNYAVGEVTDSTGNKSQGVSMDIVNKEGKVTGTVTITDVAKASDVGDVNNIASDINQDGSHTTVVDAVNNLNQKLDNKVGNLNYVEGGKGNYVTNGENTTTSIGKLDQALKDVAATAAKHTTVTQGDNITVTPGTNTDGSKNYNVALKKDITVESVTANTFKADQTVMNKDGLKVGNKVSVSATAVTAGQTSISNDGLKVNGKTYVSDSGLNANYQKITNVADGKVKKGSTDAVNGGQLYNETRVAKDGNFVKKSNTAGENLSALDNQVTANTESIYHMNGRISDLDNRVNKVGAGAAALAALHPLDFDPDAKWDFAAGYGNYRGANAAAVGAYYRPNEDTMFSVGGTFGNGENMVNAGISFKLGSGSSHVSTSRVAMAKEIKELRGELEAMKSAMLDANAGKKIDTSKLQLFPDVPQNHWAYEYVAQLAGNGMIEGYPDGNFAGDRPMTRYEFAAILYRAMTKGAVLSDKILSEFSHELEYFTVDTIAKDKAGNPTIQRVRTVKENKNK